MSFSQYLRTFRSALASGRSQRRPNRRGSRRALGLEPLEDRRLLSLTPAAILPVDLYATDVATGDFNNDGQIDVATTTSGDSVSMFLGNADGTFQPATISLIGPSPLSLDVGDFNADGNLDLAVATYDDNGTSDNDVGILLGNGDGTFADAVYLSIPNLSPGELSTSIVTGDLNADGKLDLVVGSDDYLAEEYISSVLSVLLGNGDGNFTFAATYGPYDGGGLSAPALADFSGDGNADVVVADWLMGSVEVFLSNGDGTLSEPSSFAADYGATSVVVGDFNADGKTDLVTINGLNAMYDDPVNSFSTLLGNGDGTFQTAQSFAAGIEPISAAVGEVNGDGVLDLVVANAAGGGLSVLLGQGDGSFAPPITTAAGSYPGSVVVADFNADGRLDAALADNDAMDVHQVLVLLNDGIWPDTNMPPRLSIGDVTRSEGHKGRTSFTFPVTLSDPSTEDVTVQFATADGTAKASGRDYTAQSGTLTFLPGQTSKTITVTVRGDKKSEPDETFFVNLFSVQGASIDDSQALGTILNDDGTAPPPTITIADAQLTEGDLSATGLMEFTVTLSETPSAQVTVDYGTANGSATAGSDYVSASGTLTFSPGGPLSQVIPVTVNGDEGDEGNESFFVNLSNPTGGAELGDNQAVGTILDDDGTAQPGTYTYTSSGDPINIGDNKTVSSSINISGTGAMVESLTIQINLTHARPGDLTAQLVSSSGSTLDINGLIRSDDFAHEYVVSGVTGLPLEGAWTLQVTDNVKNRKRGSLIEWKMTVTPQAAIASPQSTGTATDLALLSWFDSDPTDDDESDPLPESLVDDLALMLV